MCPPVVFSCLRFNMKNKVKVDDIADVPCFKCLFWDNLKQSHLYCNPNSCEKLEKWLFELAGEKHGTEKVKIAVASFASAEGKEQ